MLYPLMALNDGTEIVHSEMNSEGKVKVQIETPDPNIGFKTATCWLPDYKWETFAGYSEEEKKYFKNLVESMAHLILEFSQTGGFENASGL